MELVVCATKLQQLGSRKKAKIELVREKVFARLDNLRELEKLRNTSPTLSFIELIQLIAEGLRFEMAIIHFDWFKLEQGMGKLVEALEVGLLAADPSCVVPIEAKTRTAKMRWLT